MKSKNKLYASTLDYHRETPHVSLEEHVRNKIISLGSKVAKIERIYLDKRYWIILRDAEIGYSKSSHGKELLLKLRERIHSGSSICPISESIFIELLKQEDPVTRKATAKLIDELSTGVTLIQHPDRVSQELANYLYLTAGYSDLYPIEELVWTKLSNVLGDSRPANTLFSAKDELAIQKAFFDHLWEYPLSEMIEILGRTKPPADNFEQLATQINLENRKHSTDVSSFKQVYLSEFKGALSVAMPAARQIIEVIISKASGQTFEHPPAVKAAYENQLLEYFAQAFKKKEVAMALPTLHIGALCHAAVRWDKKRNLSANDFYDFHHAEAAISYCHVFMTENPLKVMLEQRHLNINNDFNCKIISSVEEALDWVSNSADSGEVAF
jgi:hypothetical protein